MQTNPNAANPSPDGGRRLSAGWVLRRLALVVFDAAAAYASYFLALLIRFYVNGQYRQVAMDAYLPAFRRFAPWYTVLALVVFACFRLYNNRWKHAGLHDLNRILAANAVTVVIQVVGTFIAVPRMGLTAPGGDAITRMPTTYYIIGALLQFALIAASRFGYRALVMERTQLGRRSASLNVMIVGAGETGRILRRQIESDRANVARPVCVFSYKDRMPGGMLDGLPVLNDLARMKDDIAKYRVQCVILADSILPPDVREQIRSVAAEAGVEVQDFSGYLQNDGAGLSPRRLLEYAGGKIRLVRDGKPADFDNGEQALMSLHGNYTVRRVTAEGGVLVVELAGASVILNDTHASWVKAVEEETGEEISFF